MLTSCDATDDLQGGEGVHLGGVDEVVELEVAAALDVGRDPVAART